MKTAFFLPLLAFLLIGGTVGYSQHFQLPSIDIITAPRWEGSGILPGWIAPKPQAIVSRGAMQPNDALPKQRRHALGSTNAGNDTRISQGSVVVVGKRFVANNLDRFTPCDNAMAISDSGFIVSADNLTIEYYDDAPDSLLQNQLHEVFYNDTTLAGVPFDPRVIYDRYSGRFIVVMLAYTNFAPNKMLVSFSKAQDPRLGWYHYTLNSDTLSQDEWFDFTSIGINKNELFIFGNSYSDSGDVFMGNKLYQIRKREGIAGQPLVYRIWPNLLDDDGNLAYSMTPLSHALQEEAYARGIYLASTKFVADTTTSNKLYWYHLTDSLDAGGVMIATHQTNAGIPYRRPLTALQLGIQDDIKITDCKVQSGYFLDSVLNFVYCANVDSFSTIVLNRLDITTNTNLRYTLGDTAGQLDYCFPSIAFWGDNPGDPDNTMMCFQRTGQTIYPELMAVNFQGGSFSPVSTVVRQGDGYIDIDTLSTTERWGDYTSIQRQYSANPKRCWLAGSYPFGANPNFYGGVNGLNTYIAEIADSAALAIPAILNSHASVSVFPIPTRGRLNIASDKEGETISQVELISMQGTSFQFPLPRRSQSATIDLAQFPMGMYILRLTLSTKEVLHEKIIVH